MIRNIKKNSPYKIGTVSLKKIVVSLAESVYSFHEPVVFFDVDVCNKQTDHRNQREKRDHACIPTTINHSHPKNQQQRPDTHTPNQRLQKTHRTPRLSKNWLYLFI